MSGVAETATAIGLVSGIISIIETIKTIHHALKDAKDLPQAFHQAGQRLPLAQDTLRIAEGYMNERKAQGDDEAMRPIVEECKNNVDKLKEVFQKVEAPPDASRLQRYRQVARALGKGARVESLMKVILEDIQRLVENHRIKAATNEQVEQLDRAIKELSEIQPSLQEEDSSVNQTHSGTGDNIYVEQDVVRGHKIHHSGPGIAYYGPVTQNGTDHLMSSDLCYINWNRDVARSH